MIMNATTIFILFAIILIIFYFLTAKKESMTNVSEKDQMIVDKIFNYITNNPTGKFYDYIKFLNEIKNTNLHIIDNEVFSGFKSLKKRNLLTKNDIITDMKL